MLRAFVGFVVGLAFLSAAHAHAAENSEYRKCLPGVIQKTSGHFLPAPAPQLLSIKQEQWTAPLSPNDVYCKFTVDVSKFDPISRAFISFWSWEMRGPGLIFTDGHWHNQPFPLHVHTQGVRLLPLPYDELDQVLIYHHDEHVDGGWSYLRVIAFTTPFGNGATLLDLSQHGGMDFEIEGKTLVIHGYYTESCYACGEPRTIRLKFDREARQFALEKTDNKSVQFYHYLTFRKIDEHLD